MRSTVPALLSLLTATWAWAQSPTLDACSVLTRQEISSLSGGHDPGSPDPNGSGDMTTCRWGGATPTAWEAEPKATADSTLPTLTALAKAAIPKLRRAG